MIGDLPREARDLGPGSRIGKYVLEQQIGHGGMAVVFLARDEQLDRPVALKVMAFEVAADTEFRQRFIRESRAAAAVNDPHIIPVFEAGEAAGALFIAMRYVAGGDVRSLIARHGPLRVGHALAILSPVAAALDAAHAAGLVHRDVKPANMLLDVGPGRPDHVYLSDFGLMKDPAASSGLTRTGMFVGTADYVAPEQIKGRRVDGRADQYALACTAVEMLTGSPPFPRDQPMDVLTAHVSEPPPPVSARRSGLPAALDAVLVRALAKSPADRYPTCGDFGEALRHAAGVSQYDVASLIGAPRPELGGADNSRVPREVRADTRPETAPQLVEPARWGGAESGGVPAEPGQARRRGRVPTARWVIAAIAAGAIAAAVFAVLARSGNAPQSGAGSGAPAGTISPRSPSPLPSPTPLNYHDPSGFSVVLPVGWAVKARSVSEVKFTDPASGFAVVVAWTTAPRPDALADWQQQAAAKAAADPTYQPILIQRVSYRGYNAADWEFTNNYLGVRVHVIDRTFIVTPGQLAYALELSGPASRWPQVYPGVWQQLLAAFEPAS